MKYDLDLWRFSPTKSFLLGVGSVVLGLCDIWRGKSAYVPLIEWFLPSGWAYPVTVRRLDAPIPFWFGVSMWFVFASMCFLNCIMVAILQGRESE